MLVSSLKVIQFSPIKLTSLSLDPAYFGQHLLNSFWGSLLTDHTYLCRNFPFVKIYVSKHLLLWRMCVQVLTINYNLKLRLQRSIGYFRIRYWLAFVFWLQVQNYVEAEFDLLYGSKAQQKVGPH